MLELWHKQKLKFYSSDTLPGFLRDLFQLYLVSSAEVQVAFWFETEAALLKSGDCLKKKNTTQPWQGTLL